MAEKETISVKADPKQLGALYSAFKTLSEEANGQLKSDVASISAWTAEGIKAAASNVAPQAYPKQASRVAQTVRHNKDRVPNVTIGGSKRLFSGGALAGEVLYGSEFGAVEWQATGQIGANRFGKYGGRRFPDRSPRMGQGNEGYWIYPTLRRMQPEITSRWFRAVEKVLGKWDDANG